MSAPAARAVAVPVPPSVLVWQFGGKAGNLTAQNTYTPNSGYNMFCKSNSKYLTYATQPAGINLGYTENAAECKVHFQLPDHQQREILTGEPVALGIGGGDEWLYYSERPLGINYKWRSTPKFEHRIWGPTGESGKKIQQNTVVAVLNVNVKPTPDFLVYLDRHPGVADVGWTTSPNWWGSLGVPLIDLVKKLLG
jgi:hypothetical protein